MPYFPPPPAAGGGGTGLNAGTAVLDFGAGPTDAASIAVTGQTGIVSGSHVTAFFARETTVDNGEEEHEGMGVYGRVSCGSVVAGTGFTIFATLLAGFATGTFNVRWIWS